MSNAGPMDREQIQDLHIRYGRGVDAGDMPLVRSCFTHDATLQYDGPNGQPGLLMRWDEFLLFWQRMQAPMGCMHQFTNFTYDFVGGDCVYSCLAFAQHWPRNADFSREVTFCTAGVRYENRARRTVEGWRIYEHRAKMRWFAGDADALWRSEG